MVVELWSVGTLCCAFAVPFLKVWGFDADSLADLFSKPLFFSLGVGLVRFAVGFKEEVLDFNDLPCAGVVSILFVVMALLLTAVLPAPMSLSSESWINSALLKGLMMDVDTADGFPVLFPVGFIANSFELAMPSQLTGATSCTIALGTGDGPGLGGFLKIGLKQFWSR